MNELVLVVESNPELRENTAEILELSGYRVLTCANSLKAYEIASTQHPDAIIYDLMAAEEIAGFFRMIKQDDTTRKIPFTMLDGILLPANTRQIVEEIGGVQLHKPFSREQLLDAVHRCLEKKNAAKE